ncbi:MAG: hypothetical protein R2849_21490 [Thermomicrobiales bacterium]
MVRKADEQGRRWKVPQNLYRVKDRQDGIDLTAADVVRVIELADKDKAVYRHIRKIFSSKFEPIDRDNVWHEISQELADHPTWMKLAARAQKQEAKASARTRAGHRARARQQQSADRAESDARAKPEGRPAARNTGADGDFAAEMTTGHDNHEPLDISKHERENGRRSPTSAGQTNNGSVRR